MPVETLCATLIWDGTKPKLLCGKPAKYIIGGCSICTKCLKVKYGINQA